MTLGNIVLYVALIAYVLFNKYKGRPVGTPKKLLALPVILIVLGFGDVGHGVLTATDIGFTVVGALSSLVLGAARGFADRLSTRDGVPYVQWSRMSFVLFGLTVLSKLIIDVVGVAAGGTAAAMEKSLILSVGLTLAGEGVVLLLRTGQVTTDEISHRINGSSR
jgi:hypothetical protein